MRCTMPSGHVPGAPHPMLSLPRAGTDAGTPGSGHVSLLGRLQGGYGCRAGWFGALTWGLLILICKEEMGQAVLVLL